MNIGNKYHWIFQSLAFMDAGNMHQILVFSQSVCLSEVHIIISALFHITHKMKEPFDLIILKGLCLFHEHQNISLTFFPLGHPPGIMEISAFIQSHPQQFIQRKICFCFPQPQQKFHGFLCQIHLIFHCRQTLPEMVCFSPGFQPSQIFFRHADDRRPQDRGQINILINIIHHRKKT